MAEKEDRVTGWTGWVGFASFMLIIAGIIQFMYGLGALFSQGWLIYTSTAIYAVDTTAWGWAAMLVGALLFVSGSLLLSGNLFGRTMGVIVAGLSFLGNLALFGAAPIWAVIAVVVDALVIYAIIAHGGEMKTLSQYQ